jgi:PST family polysaccharide transporter
MTSTTVDKSLVRKTVTGTLWTYAAHYSGKIVNLIGVTILARLLSQEEFGVASYALVVISLLDFPGLGIGPSLIYHKREKDRTNTAFWLAILIGVIMTAATALLAPLVGLYFQDARAVPVTRALSVYFILVAFGVIPSSLLNKQLSFKRKFIPDLAGAINKGVVAIMLALVGFGAWSLVAGNLINTLTTTIVLWFVWRSSWRPELHFDRQYVRPLLGYAAHIVSIYFLGILLLNVDYLLVGRYLGAAALGIYMLAFRIPELLIKQFYAAISEVLFPVFTRVKDDAEALKRGFLEAMKYISLMTVPMALGLALVARPLVLTVFGEKWAEAIPVTSAIALYTLFRSFYFNAGSLFKAQGRPDVVTRLHLFNLVILVPALWYAATQYGTISAVAWMQVAVVFFVGTIRLYVGSRMLDLPFASMIKVFVPALTGSAIMALAVTAALILTEPYPPMIQLVVAVAVGGLTYLAAIFALHRDMLLTASRTLRSALVRG